MVEIHSPTHYSVELLATQAKVNDPWTVDNKNELSAFRIKFKLFYAVKGNHASHSPVNVGDLCTISIHTKFHRARVIQIGPSKSALYDTRVSLKLIDLGLEIKSSKSKLLELPDIFKVQPPQTIDIRLGGIIPTDSEFTWDDEVTETVKKWIKRYQKVQNNYVVASVAFATNDIIWVDSVNIIEDLKSFGGLIQVKSIKTSLIKLQYGIADTKIFANLKSLAKDAGLDLIGGMTPPPEEPNLQTLEDMAEVVEDENDLQRPDEVQVFCEPNYESTVPNEEDEDIAIVSSDTNGVNFEKSADNNKIAAESEKLSNNVVDRSLPVEETISVEKIVETWQTLTFSVVHVHLSDFRTPDLIYVCKISSAPV